MNLIYFKKSILYSSLSAKIIHCLGNTESSAESEIWCQLCNLRWCTNNRHQCCFKHYRCIAHTLFLFTHIDVEPTPSPCSQVHNTEISDFYVESPIPKNFDSLMNFSDSEHIGNTSLILTNSIVWFEWDVMLLNGSRLFIYQ